MKLGEILKSQYGFDKQETVDRFLDIYKYSPVIFDHILNDQYRYLLTCHIKDISEFLELPFETVTQWTKKEIGNELYHLAPMGRPYVIAPMPMAKIDVEGLLHSVEIKTKERQGGIPTELVKEATEEQKQALCDACEKRFKEGLSIPLAGKVEVKDISGFGELRPLSEALSDWNPDFLGNAVDDVERIRMTVMTEALGVNLEGIYQISDPGIPRYNDDSVTKIESQCCYEIIDPIYSYLRDYPISQGIVGIKVPQLGTVQENEFYSSLIQLNNLVGCDIQSVIVPDSRTLPDHDASLERRVGRDRLDGIRYNRVYFALYNREPCEKVKLAHDIFFDVTEEQLTGRYVVSGIDTRSN